MHCPFCGHEETKVNDSRLAGEGHQIRRRRECLKCTERFTTFEAAELLMPQIIKSGAAARHRWRARRRAPRWGRPPGTGAPRQSTTADQPGSF